MKKCLVLGGSGFIGGHLVHRLKQRGDYVWAMDVQGRPFNYGPSVWDRFTNIDLSYEPAVFQALNGYEFDECYQLAADMGGAGYIFSGEHDADLMTNSAQINLNIAKWASSGAVGKLFYSSSACMYPHHIQQDVDIPGLKETDAYPALPDSEYGWEKLFSERLYAAYHRNYGLDIRVARFHNIYGPQGAFQGGREKAPAAICRKVAMAKDGDDIEVWGDGKQTRSFLYIDDCLDGVEALMASTCTEPRNIGSEEMVSINELARMAIEISGKKLGIKHIDGPLGVRGRNSDNTLMRATTGWEPKVRLRDGLERTYRWIAEQVK